MSITRRTALAGLAGHRRGAGLHRPRLRQPLRPLPGTTLVVNFPAHPHYDAVAKVLPKFTAETGIKVEVDKLQFLRMRDKQLLEMSKPGKGDYDLLAYVVFWKTEYAERKLIREIGPMFKDRTSRCPTMTSTT